MLKWAYFIESMKTYYCLHVMDPWTHPTSVQVKMFTYYCILLHPGFDLLHLSRYHSWKNGRVSAFTEQQVVSWERTHLHTEPNTVPVKYSKISASYHESTEDICCDTGLELVSPELDLTMTLILLLTESKFSTWSSSNLKRVSTWLMIWVE